MVGPPRRPPVYHRPPCCGGATAPLAAPRQYGGGVSRSSWRLALAAGATFSGMAPAERGAIGRSRFADRAGATHRRPNPSQQRPRRCARRAVPASAERGRSRDADRSRRPRRASPAPNATPASCTLSSVPRAARLYMGAGNVDLFSFDATNVRELGSKSKYGEAAAETDNRMLDDLKLVEEQLGIQRKALEKQKSAATGPPTRRRQRTPGDRERDTPAGTTPRVGEGLDPRQGRRDRAAAARRRRGCGARRVRATRQAASRSDQRTAGAAHILGRHRHRPRQHSRAESRCGEGDRLRARRSSASPINTRERAPTPSTARGSR